MSRYALERMKTEIRGGKSFVRLPLAFNSSSRSVKDTNFYRLPIYSDFDVSLLFAFSILTVIVCCFVIQYGNYWLGL